MTYNPQNVKELISGLIHMEKTLENKLDLLTEIGLTTSNGLTFKTCEEIRSEICETERSDDFSDNKKRPSNSVASGRERKEIGNVLRSELGAQIHGENCLRKKLEAVLSTLNAKKQKTFEFEGTEFSTSLVKNFFKECKNLPDLKVEICKSYMSLKWSNGSAEIHSYPLSKHIEAELKEAQEMLK